MDELDRREEILRFWFGESREFREEWFGGGEDFDREVSERFRADYELAAAGGLGDWKGTPRGALALILLLDQFPRNMFRGEPRSYATDHLAREVAREALERGFDRLLTPLERMFVYLPFEHSEDLEDQRLSVRLFRALEEELGRPEVLEYALRHEAVIARFGRFPHRNEILGRRSTPEELEFLSGPEAPF